MINYKDNLKKITSSLKFWEFSFAFPKITKGYRITLGEGGTPCRKSKRLGEILDIDHLYFKDEINNPTNSFKDRTAALLISHARSWEYSKVICGSNGNQGASVAAYTSLENIDCLNIIPKDIDVGKEAQMIAYNSQIKIKGDSVDQAIKETLKPKYKSYYQATPEYNPLTIEAQKTIAFEIYLQMEQIDWIIIPMGSGGLLVSLWKGFKELYQSDLIKKIPKLVGVQSKTMSPIVDKYLGKDSDRKKAINEKAGDIKSYALGTLVKNPIYSDIVIKAIKKTNGITLAVPESLILTSLEDLGRNEGIFAEPSSAMTVAALNMLRQEDTIKTDDKVICLITASGLKAPYVLEAISSRTKTLGTGGILSTKLKILSQISISSQKGIYGSKLKEIIGSVSLPAIYQHLKDLESKGLIERKKEGKNVLYFITEEGKKALNALEVLIKLI
ncbi:MAG: Transcriptional regulator [Promethearchaeota archaeon]|nr:MAG: Transcriptional regulator [Candidatus Lokiarchaeota archaeon]